MVPLKEDGSLDIERIEKLPPEEHMKQVGAFSREQFEEYVSTLSLDESREYPRTAIVNRSLKDVLASGGALATEFMKKMHKKYIK